MTAENIKHTEENSPKGTAYGTTEYDPFVRGRFPVGVPLACVLSTDLIRNGTASSPVRSGILRRRSTWDRIWRQELRTSLPFRYTTPIGAKWLCAIPQPSLEPTC